MSPLSVAIMPPPIDLSVWVDASSDFGIGLLVNQAWFAWCLVPDWRGSSHDIGWLKSLAIELTMSLIICHGFHNSSILIYSDNKGFIAAFWKGRLRNFMSNLCICQSVLASTGISLALVYVPSLENLVVYISDT